MLTDLEIAAANLETANNVLTWRINEIKNLQRKLDKAEEARSAAYLKWQDAFNTYQHLRTSEVGK